MSKLDCENIGTLVKSIEDIFGLSIASVYKIFKKLKRNRKNISPDQLFRISRNNNEEYSYKFLL